MLGRGGLGRDLGEVLGPNSPAADKHEQRCVSFHDSLVMVIGGFREGIGGGLGPNSPAAAIMNREVCNSLFGSVGCWGVLGGIGGCWGV